MAPFSVLPDALEDELHGQRLLRVEERPFERIKSRLLGSSTPFHAYLTRSPVDLTAAAAKEPSTTDDELKENQNKAFSPEQHVKFLKDLQRFRDDVILDFAAFEASIARIQFLRDANVRERVRYSAEKLRIEATGQEVRDDTARLKVRLEEAKNTLEIRKGYDVLAETITKDAGLRPRDEQDANIERLKSEIEELRNEGQDLENSWLERRAQFARLTEEGRRLRRIVRDEKEPELEEKGDQEDEGNGSDGDGEGDDNMLGMERQRDDGSNIGTPRPPGEDVSTPLPDLHESGAMTPRSPVVDIEETGSKRGLEIEGQRTADITGDDVDMQDDVEHGQPQAVPQVVVDQEMDTS